MNPSSSKARKKLEKIEKYLKTILLDSTKKESSTSDIRSILKYLCKMTVHLDDIKGLDIGKIVKKLKKNNDSEIASFATKIVANWRSLLHSQEESKSNQLMTRSDDAIQDSRISGLRTTRDSAFAEFTYLRENTYVSRKRRHWTHDEVPVCNCKPHGTSSCGDDCVNRMMYIECLADHCPCGDECSNQRLQKRIFPKLKLVNYGEKGWGLQVRQDIFQGDLVFEYYGEVIDAKECSRRQMEYANDKHKYFMSLKEGEFIDASRSAGIARFINHSCNPNCETQKWTVDGELRIGVYALKEIPKFTELTFDYKFQSFGMVQQKCLCGEKNCHGFIGEEMKLTDKDYVIRTSLGRFIQREPFARRGAKRKIYIRDPVDGEIVSILFDAKAAKNLHVSISKAVSVGRINSKKVNMSILRSKSILVRNLRRHQKEDFRHLDPEYAFYESNVFQVSDIVDMQRFFQQKTKKLLLIEYFNSKEKSWWSETYFKSYYDAQTKLEKQKRLHRRIAHLLSPS